MMKLLDGRKVAEEIEQGLVKKIQALKKRGKNLTLAAILVGDDEASRIYIKVKERACRKLGLGFRKFEFGEKTKESEVIELIESLDEDPEITGILLQLPLPPGLNRERIVSVISLEKDIDGFGFIVGRPNNKFFPPAPLGIIGLLEEYNISLKGKKAVIVGEGFLVGRPLKKMLKGKGVRIVTVTKEADILVSASGKPHLIKENMVKKGAVVVDVGNFKKGEKIVGEVDFEKVAPKTVFITPVPGGVGPMTVIMLLVNLVKAGEE